MQNNFLEKIKSIYSPEDQKIVLAGLKTENRPVTFRVNKLLSNTEEVESELEKNDISFEKIDILEGAYKLSTSDKESILWELDIYKSGKIYLQSISSQMPVHMFSKTDQNINILDATAAPGGKTSQLSEMFPNAQIFAFEKALVRFNKLIHNLKKLGAKNVKGVNSDVRKIDEFMPTGALFDKILIDAPCSSEGRFDLNNEKTFENWDHITNRKYFKIQKSIIDGVLPYLKEGGELIYSTCTLSPEENEGVVHYILCNYPGMQVEKIDLDYDFTRPGLKVFGKNPYKKELVDTVRCLPTTDTEGFYIAKLKRI